ncbi:MAG: hypothetical protein UR31_C0035G0003 [Parcubacteria group bacterium GW2011_GWA2_33_14]|uniref:Uncharacterized protein n=1 Tax=Candidatus Staskawiczbacteria bacterium RIFCSPHIGHO2_02_FULL_33_16 TaxID=1802204 RepID=A0A1G2HT59_9BACT|nr:MAG: hypothetical protein UR31_C0035G0003 [Parcubacteria group bacterium GW2011_GWA2_33_14]OGZ65722.1 MAG: hypothetical protein A3D34_03445 [Candidatus Staskawiczbacteria bacterium RIFCSPHIGHO2_02_FULL_33_16]OGZ70285.1 MAG: hypothetical protein A2980_01935 [Candidatus Staskawiczbacteria bacterium RIFCSPLOWO2_01_FULL_33_13]
MTNQEGDNFQPEQERPNIGKRIADLLRLYANPEDSTNHADLAQEIRIAIKKEDKKELIKKLEYFGNARNNKSGTQQMQMLESSCASESYSIISELKALEDVPWDELLLAIGV